MRLELTKGFKERVRGRYGRYSFEVGVLQDAPHKDAARGKRGLKGEDVITNYAGGKRRKVSNKSSTTIAAVSKENRERLGFNYLTKPFEKRSSDLIKFANAFLKMVGTGSKDTKRVENLLQAVVRNPILRGEYGKNSALTVLIKGFDRSMIDTAQLFKALRARTRVRSFFGGSK